MNTYLIMTATAGEGEVVAKLGVAHSKALCDQGDAFGANSDIDI